MHKSKLRVLFVLQNFYCGGGNLCTLNLLRHLDKTKFEPILFLLERRGVYFGQVPNHVKLVCADESHGYSKYRIPYYLAKIVAEARRSNVVVGALELLPTYFAYMAATLTKRPAIGWVHVPLDRWLKKYSRKHSLVVRLLYPRLTRVVCISQTAKQSMLKVAHIRRDRLTVIYSPYDLNSLIEKGKQLIPDWAADIFAKPTLIAVGRMDYEKGFDILIKAHKKVLEKGIEHNLIIIGPTYPLGAELQALVRRLNLTRSIFIKDYVENPYPLIKKATAVVVSSRFEGLSNVMIEALALGKPIVATACGGPTEILSDGENGLLVPPEDVDGLANGMSRILTDHSLREILSMPNGEQLSRFSPENIVPQWEQLLMEITR